jgi:hypothetical protein
VKLQQLLATSQSVSGHKAIRLSSRNKIRIIFIPTGTGVEKEMGNAAQQ